MERKFNFYWLFLILPVFFLTWYFISKEKKKPAHFLAYFGPKNALKVNDTLYHFIPEFSFTNQYNHEITHRSVEGKIYVTEFFFTTCQSICPVMNNNLEKVYAEFKNDPDFWILSHTVDPETDSVPVLRSYAGRRGVKDDKWQFLTGDKRHLYEVARKGYLLDAEEGNGGDEDFIHTQNFALVDKERHIRGFYDGTDSLDIERLIQEVKLLKNEYAYREHLDR